MEPDATNSLTNEQIARMLSYHGPVVNELGFHAYDRDVALCIRDLAPEIVRRGYWLEICYVPGNTCVRLGQVGNGNALKTYVVLGDPPSIAKAICEALAVAMGVGK